MRPPVRLHRQPFGGVGGVFLPNNNDSSPGSLIRLISEERKWFAIWDIIFRVANIPAPPTWTIVSPRTWLAFENTVRIVGQKYSPMTLAASDDFAMVNFDENKTSHYTS